MSLSSAGSPVSITDRSALAVVSPFLPMASLQLAGLASNFDWKTFVDSIIQTERAPITRLQTEKNTNTSKLSALDSLKAKIADLQTSAQTLSGVGLFSGRVATSQTTGSTWATSAATGTASGNYTIAVSRLATATSHTGTSDVGLGISASDVVSGVTLASMSTAVAPTAGVFTINGKQITVATTDSLQDVFDRIASQTAGAGDVTASYSAATDKITLSSSSTITLGASNDTSNFLKVAKLSNNAGTSVVSGGALGAVKLAGSLANARLRTAVTGDGSGNGSFSVNGVSIAYNINTDSLSGVMAKINASSAGVTASYDATNDRLIFKNKNTGNLGINFSDTTGNFLAATGIGAGTTSFGDDAQFTVNGGPTLTSSSNTLDASAHGIAGLSVTVNSNTAETITVSNNTTTMRKSIEDFITKFNAVQSYISEQTKVTTSNGKVTSALMANNREIQNWATSFRSAAFSAVSNVTGSIQRLENLGIDFNSGTSQLSIKDSSKLDTALRDNSADVESFFKTASTGFAAKIDSFATSILGTGTSATGLLNAQKSTLNSSNTNIDRQIADLERRLTAERTRMESGFIAMESAQSKIQQMQQQLTNAFNLGTSK